MSGSAKMLENEAMIDYCPGMEGLFGTSISRSEKNRWLEWTFEARMPPFNEPYGKCR